MTVTNETCEMKVKSLDVIRLRYLDCSSKSAMIATTQIDKKSVLVMMTKSQLE